MSFSKTDTTSHLASADHLANSPSPSPHRNPCKPLPHLGSGSQSWHSTAPFSGHLKPFFDVMFAPHVRRTKTRFSFRFVFFEFFLVILLYFSLLKVFKNPITRLT